MGYLVVQTVERIDAHDIGEGPLLLLIRLGRFADDNTGPGKVCGANAYPSQRKLAYQSGLSHTKSSRKRTEVLEDHGWIRETPEGRYTVRYKLTVLKARGPAQKFFDINMIQVVRMIEGLSIANAIGALYGTEVYLEIMAVATNTLETDWDDSARVHLPYFEKKYSSKEDGYRAYEQYMSDPNSLVTLSDDIAQDGDIPSFTEEEVILTLARVLTRYEPLDSTINDNWTQYVENLSWTPDKKKAEITRSLDPDDHTVFIDTVTYMDEDGHLESRGWSETGDQPEREPGETAVEFSYRLAGDSRLRARQRAVMDHLNLDDDVRRMVDECEDKSWETITDLRVLIAVMSR